MKIRRIGDRENQNHQAMDPENEVSNFSCLPISLLLEIFVRLPTSALIYCALVCKSWHQFLSEPSFSDYYEKYSGNTHLLLPVVLYFCDPGSEPFYLLEFDKNGICTSRLIKVQLPARVPVQRWPSDFVVGSCNGLLVLTLFGRIVYISNPMTGGCIELPKPKKDRIEMDKVRYKIGFSPSENKFKVMRVAYYTQNHNEVYNLSILTVGVDDEWRRLTLPCRKWWFSSNWICANGAFHWILEDNNGSSWISTFDLAEEKFGRISHPPDVDLDSGDVRLELYDNRLTLIDSSYELHVDLWTMSDTKTWSKDEILYSWFPSDLRLSKIFPVGKLRNGDVLFGNSTRLIYIDVKGKTCSRIHVLHFPKILPSIMTYTPRFIPFKKDIMEGNEGDVHVQPTYVQEESCPEKAAWKLRAWLCMLCSG
ncbi:F-box protein at3g07870 [Phtheirospermum japonicum]|uniref:F-box protein at3g07870 n=1 Tax=Phtheirospermum japonicum TaxID=374723 RepID=A0A830DE03_9LAMI|nr:F-box protein at3g07870 [Phtheirospermum japonicum]